MRNDRLVRQQWMTLRKNISTSGFNSYQEYLNSPHWERVRSEFSCSLLPQSCLICKDPKYQLHHKSYQRLGFEMILDLVPLCGSCHRRFHELDVPIRYPQIAIRKILNISPAEAMARLRRFNLSTNFNFRTLPSSKRDLVKMEKLLGVKSSRMQHERLFPSLSYPIYFMMNDDDVEFYCMTINGSC